MAILSFETNALPLEVFSRDGDKLVACLSDFGRFQDQLGGPCGLKFIQRVYDDACDAGIGVRSATTGRVVRFFWHEGLGRNPDYSLGHDTFEFEVIHEDRDQPIKRVIIFMD